MCLSCSNLYHVVSGKTTSHSWQIYITDILGSNRRRQTCNFLQILYDPDNKVGGWLMVMVVDGLIVVDIGWWGMVDIGWGDQESNFLIYQTRKSSLVNKQVAGNENCIQ